MRSAVLLVLLFAAGCALDLRGTGAPAPQGGGADGGADDDAATDGAISTDHDDAPETTGVNDAASTSDGALPAADTGTDAASEACSEECEGTGKE